MAHSFKDYAKRARSRFCAGSRKTPIELVMSGKRTIEDGVEMLNQERQRSEHWGFEREVKARDNRVGMEA